MGKVAGLFSLFFTPLVGFSVLILALRRPKDVNSLAMAGGESISGVTRTLEGR